MVSTTRPIIWRTDDSRSGVPSGPRKYFWATMFVAFCDQDLGNSTPRCSKALPPSLKLGMTASRVSHSISSKGWTPSRVKYRLNESPSRMTLTSRSCVAIPRLLSGLGGKALLDPCGKSVENHRDVILARTHRRVKLVARSIFPYL